MPPQLEKNHVGPTAWQDEALARGLHRETEGRLPPSTEKAIPSVPRMFVENNNSIFTQYLLSQVCCLGWGYLRVTQPGLTELSYLLSHGIVLPLS